MNERVIELPTWLQTLSTQIRLIRRTRRKGLTILMAIVVTQIVFMASFGILLGVTFTTSDEGTEVGFSHVSRLDEEFELELGEGGWALAVGFLIFAIFGLFWPVSVWSDDRPAERSYHWAMPVERSRHDLTRVLAGGIIYWVLLAIVYLVAVGAALVSGNTAGLDRLTLWSWLGLIMGPAIPYTVGSVFAVRFEHPMAWFWGTIGGIGTLWTVSNVLDLHVVEAAFVQLALGVFGILQAIVGPTGAELFGWPTTSGVTWMLGWAIWMTFLGAAVVIAATVRARSH